MCDAVEIELPKLDRGWRPQGPNGTNKTNSNTATFALVVKKLPHDYNRIDIKLLSSTVTKWKGSYWHTQKSDPYTTSSCGHKHKVSKTNKHTARTCTKTKWKKVNGKWKKVSCSRTFRTCTNGKYKCQTGSKFCTDANGV